MGKVKYVPKYQNVIKLTTKQHAYAITEKCDQFSFVRNNQEESQVVTSQVLLRSSTFI